MGKVKPVPAQKAAREGVGPRGRGPWARDTDAHGPTRTATDGPCRRRREAPGRRTGGGMRILAHGLARGAGAPDRRWHAHPCAWSGPAVPRGAPLGSRRPPTHRAPAAPRATGETPVPLWGGAADRRPPNSELPERERPTLNAQRPTSKVGGEPGGIPELPTSDLRPPTSATGETPVPLWRGGGACPRATAPGHPLHPPRLCVPLRPLRWNPLFERRASARSPTPARPPRSGLGPRAFGSPPPPHRPPTYRRTGVLALSRSPSPVRVVRAVRG